MARIIRPARDSVSEPKGAAPSGGERAFRPGDRVRHAVFGEGYVLALDEEKGAYVIQFDKLDTPRSIAFRIRLDRA